MSGSDPAPGMPSPRMRCWIYRGRRRDETFLYVRERDEFEPVPDALLEALGALEFVMELELDSSRKLARAEVGEVMRQLGEVGYYLQMPPTERALAGNVRWPDGPLDDGPADGPGGRA